MPGYRIFFSLNFYIHGTFYENLKTLIYFLLIIDQSPRLLVPMILENQGYGSYLLDDRCFKLHIVVV